MLLFLTSGSEWLHLHSSIFSVKYEARLENAALVSKSDEGVEFNVSDGKLNLLVNKLWNYTSIQLESDFFIIITVKKHL